MIKLSSDDAQAIADICAKAVIRTVSESLENMRPEPIGNNKEGFDHPIKSDSHGYPVKEMQDSASRPNPHISGIESDPF